MAGLASTISSSISNLISSLIELETVLAAFFFLPLPVSFFDDLFKLDVYSNVIMLYSNCYSLVTLVSFTIEGFNSYTILHGISIYSANGFEGVEIGYCYF